MHPGRDDAHLGPRALPDLRRRAGPPVRRPDLPDRRRVPARVVDLGCGPGNLTALLAARWPDATVTGLDSSPEMIEAARRDVPGIEFEVADLRDWVSTGSTTGVDVLVSNATLQWVPGHLDLLPSLVATVAPGGWFAFQVPGNFDEPSHTIRTRAGRRAGVRRAHRRRRGPGLARPGRLLRRAGGRRLRGRRLGDDVPARPQRPRPGLHLGLRHRRPADAAGAAGRPAGRASRPSSRPGSPRRTPPAPTAPCCCRSAGSSWSRRCTS